MKCLSVITATVAACSLLGACGDVHRNDYSGYRNLPDRGWKFGNAVEFLPVHADSVCAGSLVVALRHDNSYPFTAIRLEIEMTDNGTCRRDTVDVALAGESGQWTGRGIGTSFQMTDTLAPMLHATGTPVKVRHLMRADTLAGINQVGLFFVPMNDTDY